MNKPTFLAALSLCVNFSSSSFAQQPLPAENLVEQVPVNPPAILSLRERAKLEDKWLTDRLDNVLPALMRE